MTEIEMDIDVTKPGFGERIGDDSIDFDTDMVDSNADLQKLDQNLQIADREMQDEEDTANHHAYETNGMMSEDVDFDLHDVEDIANNPEHADYETSEAPEPQTQEPALVAQPSNEDAQEHEDDVEYLNETDVHGDDVPADHTSTHEIDYEFEDHAAPDDLHRNVNVDATRHSAESTTEQAASADVDHDSNEAESKTTVPKQNAFEHIEDERDASGHDDQKEPQDLQEVVEHDEAHAFGGTEAETENTNADEHVNASEDNGGTHGEEYTAGHEEIMTLGTREDHDTVEDVENNDQGEHGPNEYNEDGPADLEHTDHQSNDEDLNGKTDDDFPAITVQYKGDEFPLFSTTTNGFFTDMSVLDEPLEKLLAGLRNELENEIPEDDDLVLQVDELGLELAETTQGELMTNVTFRQILEIFDLLVKNQDPDSSRTLYTYLFTKPNTERRLESLIESATAGKGLDEVIHLFETPMTSGTSILETAATIDGVHEELDEFDSPVDEEHPDEAKDKVDDDYPEDEQANPDGSAPESQEIDGQEVDDQEEDGQADHDVAAGIQTEMPADASAVEANPEAAGEAVAGAENEPLEQNARADSEIDPFANLELDGDVEVNDDVDLENNLEAEERVDVEPDAVRAQTNDTSTTTTLQGEEEAASINVDLGADHAEAETAAKDNSGEDDLDEIDWRDEPGADDEGPTTPSAAGKRSRGDDDGVNAEDEQDAKRRRP